MMWDASEHGGLEALHDALTPEVIKRARTLYILDQLSSPILNV